MTNIKPVTMTAKEAALYIGISYWLLLEMTKQNKVPFISCGSRKLFRKEALDNWMTEREKNSIDQGTKDTEYGTIRKIY